MSDHEDFYYRRKPHASIVRRQSMSPEQRSASYTYEDQMHARDGTLPDERTADGLLWHRRVLNVGNSRTVHRVVCELLKVGDLVRLGDGRLTNPEVQREMAHRARKRTKPGGGENEGGGQAPPAQRQLVLIDGGRSPQDAVDRDEDSLGTAEVCPEFAGSSGQTSAKPRQKTQQNQRPASLMYRESNHHEVVVAVPFDPARARSVHTLPWPTAGPLQASA